MVQHGMRAFSKVRYGLLLLTAVAVAMPGLAEGTSPTVSFGSRDLAGVARATQIGGSVKACKLLLSSNG